MDTVKLYIDGALVASTATNAGAYVAMENLATPPLIGAYIGTAGTSTNHYSYELGLQGIDGSEWSASIVWRVHQLLKGFYGL